MLYLDSNCFQRLIQSQNPSEAGAFVELLGDIGEVQLIPSLAVIFETIGFQAPKFRDAVGKTTAKESAEALADLKARLEQFYEHEPALSLGNIEAGLASLVEALDKSIFGKRLAQLFEDPPRTAGMTPAQAFRSSIITFAVSQALQSVELYGPALFRQVQLELIVYCLRSRQNGTSLPFFKLIRHKIRKEMEVKKQELKAEGIWQENQEKKFLGPYKDHGDWCDGELLHLAIAGARLDQSFSPGPTRAVFCLTTDDPNLGLTRLVYAKPEYLSAASATGRWSPFIPGYLGFLDKKTLRFSHFVDVSRFPGEGITSPSD